MKKEYKARFGDAPWAGKETNIVIGGAGGIGSWVALALARAGHNLVVYDMDEVDATNMAGQMYTETAIGKKKTAELANNVKAFTGSDISTFGEFGAKSFVAPVTVSAFDNMEARMLMFEKWKAQENRELFLDGRMTAEYFEVYAVQKGMEKEYEKYLFPSSEASVLPCSFKSTTHNAMGIAYIMTGALNNYFVQDPTGLRAVPFRTECNIALFMFDQTLAETCSEQ